MTTKVCDTRTDIETPENVILTFELAGPGSRIAAYLIDFVIRFVVGFGIVWCLSQMFPVLGGGISIGLMLLGMFLLEWGYCACLEGLWRGQTPGKRFMHLRVVKDAGYPVHFYDAALRNLLRAADILPIGYGVGLVSMMATRRLQRIGDLVAGTIVVREQAHPFERLTSLFDGLDPIQPSECAGQYSVSERTLDVVGQLFARRARLPRRRVDEIAGILAEPIAAQIGYGLTDDSTYDRNTHFLRRVLRTFSMADESPGK